MLLAEEWSRMFVYANTKLLELGGPIITPKMCRGRDVQELFFCLGFYWFALIVWWMRVKVINDNELFVLGSVLWLFEN